jgi:hypothetical protein
MNGMNIQSIKDFIMRNQQEIDQRVRYFKQFTDANKGGINTCVIDVRGVASNYHFEIPLVVQSNRIIVIANTEDEPTNIINLTKRLNNRILTEENISTNLRRILQQSLEVFKKLNVKEKELYSYYEDIEYDCAFIDREDIDIILSIKEGMIKTLQLSNETREIFLSDYFFNLVDDHHPSIVLKEKLRDFQSKYINGKGDSPESKSIINDIELEIKKFLGLKEDEKQLLIIQSITKKLCFIVTELTQLLDDGQGNRQNAISTIVLHSGKHYFDKLNTHSLFQPAGFYCTIRMIIPLTIDFKVLWQSPLSKIFDDFLQRYKHKLEHWGTRRNYDFSDFKNAMKEALKSKGITSNLLSTSHFDSMDIEKEIANLLYHSKPSEDIENVQKRWSSMLYRNNFSSKIYCPISMYSTKVEKISTEFVMTYAMWAIMGGPYRHHGRVALSGDGTAARYGAIPFIVLNIDSK